MDAARKGKEKVDEDKSKEEEEELEEKRKELAKYMLKKFPAVATADHDTKLRIFEECLRELSEEQEKKSEEQKKEEDEDPWKIKVQLQRCDMNDKLVLFGLEFANQGIEKTDEFVIWDVDTQTKHTLQLVKKATSIFFTGNWNKDFLVRRELKLYETVGFYWDDTNKRYNFSVLERDTL
ncbi:hypothetical protein Fmac_016540 [Flemingia macrophylla]|uniref:Uncharacterized protein n=1 Tax=Flemingia macrophylla TaxID=520843 RepID=A0ABD1MID5_9FABA